MNSEVVIGSSIPTGCAAEAQFEDAVIASKAANAAPRRRAFFRIIEFCLHRARLALFDEKTKHDFAPPHSITTKKGGLTDTNALSRRRTTNASTMWTPRNAVRSHRAKGPSSDRSNPPRN